MAGGRKGGEALTLIGRRRRERLPASGRGDVIVNWTPESGGGTLYGCQHH